MARRGHDAYEGAPRERQRPVAVEHRRHGREVRLEVRGVRRKDARDVRDTAERDEALLEEGTQGTPVWLSWHELHSHKTRDAGSKLAE